MSIPSNLRKQTFLLFIFYSTLLVNSRTLSSPISIPTDSNDFNPNSSSPVYLWPLPSNFTFGNQTLSIDPDLSLTVSGNVGNSVIVNDAFYRYRKIIFKHETKLRNVAYDIRRISVVVHSDDQEVRIGNCDCF